jgi:phage/plasmid-like protein (TIGR03299 family)
MTSSDGFFAVRQAAWHGLGTVFEDYPKRVEAQQLAHPWEPMAVPVYTRRVVVERDEITGQEVEREVFEEIKGHVANIRDDNRAELGVVPVTYNLVQNSQLWDVAEALENSGPDVMFETGGSYGGGKGVWVLIRLKEPLIVRGDPRGETIPYYALQNSHDGTGAFRGQATMTRIVCANTSRIADVEAKARGTEFAFRHSKNVDDRIEEAREALAGWRQALADWQDTSQELISKPVTDGNAVRFLHKFIPMPPRNLISDKVEQNVHAARAQWKEAYEGITGEGIKGTAYGLVQASIEYQEWYRRANNSESRFKRSFLSRNTIVSDAVALALTASSESVGQ